MGELTDKEKEFLKLLLKIGYDMIQYMRLDNGCYIEFDNDDLTNLADKLGIENFKI